MIDFPCSQNASLNVPAQEHHGDSAANDSKFGDKRFLIGWDNNCRYSVCIRMHTMHLNKALSYKWVHIYFRLSIKDITKTTPTDFLKTGNKIKAKYLQSLSAAEMLPLLMLPGGQKISLSAEHSSHNTMQGLHLHVSRGDNVICINLMSLSEGKKMWTPAETSWHCSKAFFFPYYSQYWPWLADKALLHR